MESNWELEFYGEKINGFIESMMVNDQDELTINKYLSKQSLEIESIDNIFSINNDLRNILKIASSEINKFGFKVIPPNLKILPNNDDFRFPIYILSSNVIVFPLSFINFFCKKDVYSSEIIMFFLLHEFAHFIVHKHKQVINTTYFFQYKYKLFELYNTVFLYVNNRKIKLDISRVINEIIPDFISIFLMYNFNKDVKTDINKLKDRMLSLMIDPYVNNEKIIEIFSKDKHAPIEIRISLSVKALKDV